MNFRFSYFIFLFKDLYPAYLDILYLIQQNIIDQLVILNNLLVYYRNRQRPDPEYL